MTCFGIPREYFYRKLKPKLFNSLNDEYRGKVYSTFQKSGG